MGLSAALASLGFLLGSCQYGNRPAPAALHEARPQPATPSSALAAQGAAAILTAAAAADGGQLAAAAPAAAAPDGGAAIAPVPQLPAVKLGGPVPMARLDSQRTGRSPYLIPMQAPREVWRFQAQGAVVAAPTVAADGTVLFTSHDRHVYALAADGTLRWKYQTGDFVWSSAALASGDLVLLGSDDDQLHALRLSDGEKAWALRPGGCRRATGRGPEAARCDIEDVTLGPDGTFYISGDGVYAVQPTGTVRWRFVPEPDQQRKRHCGSAPTLGRDGAVYAVCSDQLYALNPDGSRRWQLEAPGEWGSAPAIGADGTLYLGDEQRKLIGVDPAGQIRFSFVVGGAVRSAPAVRSDGLIVFGAYDGVLYALKPDGTLAWSFATADSIGSSPLVDSAGAVLVGSRDNRLYAVAADGRLRWSVVLDDDVDGTPALGPDGTIYVGSDDRALHAFR